MTEPASVIWHDLECGAYREDLALWSALAAATSGPVLDVGAGSGRVALHLAAAGHDVIALDRDPELLAALGRRARAAGLAVRTLLADARTFTAPEPVGIVLVPMQTVQLLAGSSERREFLDAAASALVPGGRIAVAIAEALEPFEVDEGAAGPLPDVGEIDGTVYSSRPLAIRPDAGDWVLERRRETVTPTGELATETDLVRLAALTASELEREGEAVGLRVAPRLRVETSADYVGSTVVVLDA